MSNSPDSSSRRLTNKYNLPTPLVEALAADPYDAGGADLSVTSIWKPTQLIDLVRRHRAEIEVDASDLIPSALGSAFHTLMERADRHAIKEKRLFAHIEGKLISGQFDRLILENESATLQDYKVTTVARFSRHSHGADDEWAQQLNTYAFLLRLNGIQVSALQVIVILRNWERYMLMRSLDYPPLMVQVVNLPLWDPAEAEERIRARVRTHEVVSPCTPEEMWYKPAKFAVMREGRRSAVRLFDNEAAAQYFISTLKGTASHYIERRPEIYTRCEEYCEAAPFCPQWKAIRPEKTPNE